MSPKLKKWLQISERTTVHILDFIEDQEEETVENSSSFKTELFCAIGTKSIGLINCDIIIIIIIIIKFYCPKGNSCTAIKNIKNITF